MRTLRVVSVGIIALAFAVPSRVLTQKPPAGGRAGVYDTSTVKTVKGEVADIPSTLSPQGLGGGRHVSLKVGTQLLDVHLAPQWFLDSKSLNLTPGDQIEVMGSRLTYEGRLVFLAARITVGSRAVALRDSLGIPLWEWARDRGKPPHA